MWRLAVVLFEEKSGRPSSMSRVLALVICCFGVEANSGFEIVEKKPLNGECREIPESH